MRLFQLLIEPVFGGRPVNCSTRCWRLTATAVVVAGLACAGLSCSSKDRYGRQKVHGQIWYNEQPLKGAMVVFHPVGQYPSDLPKPLAWTDAEGRFNLTTERPGDGVPLGQYTVTVECRERTYSGAEKVKGRNLLPTRYSKAQTSGLTIDVHEGDNDLPLHLTDK
jgi:hypothetical protein